MAATLFKEVNYSLSKLTQDIQLGEIGLPDIQRPFVWSNAKVRDLFDSMYQGFPVGYLLFWSNAVAEGSRQIGAETERKVPRLLIVDGQQRLTSLFAVLKGQPVIDSDYSKQHIQIAFRPRDGKFEVADAAVHRDYEFIPDISQVWRTEDSYTFVKHFIAQLRKHRDVTEEEEVRLAQAISRLYNLQNYPFTALELSSSVNEEKVAEVFVRINSQGVTLNQADFILTLMSVFWDQGRADLESFCRRARQQSSGEASPYNRFVQPSPDQLLRVGVALAFRRARLQHVYSILRGKDLETGQFSDVRRLQQFTALQDAQGDVLALKNWHEFFNAMLRAGYRSGQMVSSQTGMFYAYAMFLIGRCDFGMEYGRLREVIARWFFMTSLTARYSASSESAMEEDLARLRGVKDADGFVDTLDRVIADTLTEDFWNIRLPDDLATSSARTPSLFAYRAALNLLDARVLFSQLRVADLIDPAVQSTKSSVERHHLFPRNYLVEQGITDQRDINQIANYALLEWSDNIRISDDPPGVYFPEYIAERKLSDIEVRRMCYWHALPAGWEQMGYREFLEARRPAMARVIRDGFATLAGQSAIDAGWGGHLVELNVGT